MTETINKTVLVVDDEKDVRHYLSMALRDAGLNVVTASDGNEALQIIKKDPPDAISLDLVMPGKSGAKLYHELQKKSAWSKIPVLIVTGHARDDLGKADLKDLTISGPGIYLEKPVKPHNYVAAIKKLLDLKINGDEAVMANTVEIQNELKNLIDNADSKTLEALKELITRKTK